MAHLPLFIPQTIYYYSLKDRYLHLLVDQIHSPLFSHLQKPQKRFRAFLFDFFPFSFKHLPIFFSFFQMDYILGVNNRGQSYMAGYGSKFPLQPHHRGASIPSVKVLPSKVDCGQGFSLYFNTNEPNPNVHVGAIVGGPSSVS